MLDAEDLWARCLNSPLSHPPQPPQPSAPAGPQKGVTTVLPGEQDRAEPEPFFFRSRTRGPTREKVGYPESKQLTLCRRGHGSVGKAGLFSESNTQVLQFTNVHKREWVTTKHCPPGKLMNDYRYKERKWKHTHTYIYIYIYMNFGLLCNKANYNLSSELPDIHTKLPFI